MTTIATDGKTMAGDSQITGCGTIHSTTFQKIHRLNDGSIFGFTGTPYDLEAWLAFLNGSTPEMKASAESEALVLRADGTILCFNEIGRCYKQSAPAAAGSGTPYALGAMLAGATPREAVTIAAQLDAGSGGDVVEMTPDKA